MSRSIYDDLDEYIEYYRHNNERSVLDFTYYTKANKNKNYYDEMEVEYGYYDESWSIITYDTINHYPTDREAWLAYVYENGYDAFRTDDEIYGFKEDYNEDDFYDYEYDEWHDDEDDVYDRIYLEGTDYTLKQIYIDECFKVYKCDRCNTDFVDFKDYYFDTYKSKNKNFGFDDLCGSCRREIKSEKRKEINIKAVIKTDGKSIPYFKQQEYLAKLFNGKMNYPIGKYFVDIILKDRIVIEYDGSGHWLSAVFGLKTYDEIEERDMCRDEYLQSIGFKVIRIISKKDLLPDKDNLLQFLNECKKEFDKGITYIKIEVESKFPHFTLRKITDKDLEDLEYGNSKN